MQLQFMILSQRSPYIQFLSKRIYFYVNSSVSFNSFFFWLEFCIYLGILEVKTSYSVTLNTPPPLPFTPRLFYSEDFRLNQSKTIAVAVNNVYGRSKQTVYIYPGMLSMLLQQDKREKRILGLMNHLRICNSSKNQIIKKAKNKIK